MANKKKNSGSKPLAAQVQSVVDSALNKLTSNPGKSRKKRNRNQNASSQNAPVAVRMGQNVISGTQSTAGTVTVSNTEYVADIVGASGNVLGLDVNPSNPLLFPWLSRLAINYEMFRFKRLEFRYTPSCSSQTSGTVVAAFDYDASDDQPSTKQQISGYGGARRGNIWSAMSAPMNAPVGWRFVGEYSAARINPPNTDIKLYDVAKFYIGIFNTTGSQTYGDLTVSYTVEFIKPDVKAPYQGTLSCYLAPTASSKASPVGTSIALDIGNAGIKISNKFDGVGNPGIVIDFPVSMPAFLELSALVRHASSSINAFSSIEYFTSPGVWSQVISSQFQTHDPWQAAGTDFRGTANIIFNVLAGSQILLWINPAVTAFVLEWLRVMTYPPQLSKSFPTA